MHFCRWHSLFVFYFYLYILFRVHFIIGEYLLTNVQCYNSVDRILLLIYTCIRKLQIMTTNCYSRKRYWLCSCECGQLHDHTHNQVCNQQQFATKTWKPYAIAFMQAEISDRILAHKSKFQLYIVTELFVGFCVGMQKYSSLPNLNNITHVPP